MTTFRLAVVGAGPAGIYAADLVSKSDRSEEISIDLFDRLPAPYGLVRYGVAPDHPRIKGIINALRDVLDRGDIRVFGNVEYGVDITLNDLQQHYHAVIFATGAIRDAELRLPGNDLAGVFGAAAFVNWYDGHPDFPKEWPLDADSVAVIGNGNVALDVARLLVKKPNDLLSTEIPDNVYQGLVASTITDVHVFGRRGPMQVKFTPLELREMGELNDVDIILNPEDFVYDEASKTAIANNKQLLVIDRIFRSWLDRPLSGAKRRLHFHFYSRPDELLPDDSGTKLAAFRYERTRPDNSGGAVGTGEFHELEMQQAYRAIGYFGSPLPELPFDEGRGVIPNNEGRVQRADATSPGQFNEDFHGVYVTGWIKRGPIGLIGHTKSDAMQTVQHLLNDSGSWWSPLHTDPNNVTELLNSRGVRFTDITGWHRLDAQEIALGQAQGRERIKVVDREEMLRISRDEAGDRD
ncbi:MAG: FAD-dependent oxidoreductase [Microbacteriaceae bacterium]